jgi:histidinol-phosphate aminotransferase
MQTSRREWLLQIGAGAAALTAAPAIGAAGLGSTASRIRLDGSGSAHGPSPLATAALRDAVGAAACHPGTAAESLRTKIAGVHRVAEEQVVLGCGSTEILRMAADGFLGPGRNVVLASPTCTLISDFARRAGADVIAVPLTGYFAHDLDRMLARVNDRTGLVYICNPNSPTGTLTDRRRIERFLAAVPAATHVLIDEAYLDYVGARPDAASFIDRPVDNPRVVVARTFSKVYGLAGMRVGYAVAASAAARILASRSLPANVGSLGALAAAAALDDRAHVESSVRRNIDERQEFYNQAIGRLLHVIDSHTNFVMVDAAQPAAPIVDHFARNGIVLPSPFAPFDNYVRVSIGTAEEMSGFWRVWDLMHLPVGHHH